MKIRIRKEEGGLEVLAEVENKASDMKMKLCQNTAQI